MSYWVAGAAVVSALIGAGSSKKASKDAAKGQAKGLSASQAMNEKAIGQAKDYFNIGQRSSQAGFQSALDFFKNTQPAKYEPMIQGNVAAQRVIGQGAQQANNAILGLPVDMSFANQQTAIQPNYSAVQSAHIPVLGGQEVGPKQSVSQQAAPVENEGQQKQESGRDRTLTLGGYAAGPKEMFKPENAIKNPWATLGFGTKITDKIDPVKKTKKLIKKIF